MKLRTPRRRMTPQAKLRYRAIRGFLRRALGTQSQNTIQVESSGSSNGTDVQNKVLRLRDHLKAVSYCSELLESPEITSRSINQSAQDNTNFLTIKNRSDHCRRAIGGTETEVLYQTTENQFQNTYCSDESQHSVNETSLVNPEILQLEQRARLKKKKREKIENMSPRFGSDYNRLHSYIHKTINQRTDDRAPSVTCYHQNLTTRKRNRRFKKTDQNPEVETHHRKPDYNKCDEQLRIHKSDSQGRYHQVTPRQNRKSKSSVDQDFIADIIQRQYKPVKRFVTKESAISQFTVPECMEMAPTYCSFGAMNDITCPCVQNLCHDRKQRGYNTGHGDYCNKRGISELGSICDTRLYSNRQRSHPIKPRRTENYNDSTLYDVIPVKERSSPKIRRRQTEYDLTDDSQPYVDHCRRAVPPSPRSQRPRLNLRSQFYQDCVHYSPRKNTNGKSSSKLQRRKPNPDVLKTFNGWDIQDCENCTKRLLNGYQMIGGENRIPETNYVYSNEFSDLNNSEDTKTVNALSEIKDLLKNFLDELKKDVSGRQSNQSTSNGIHAQTSNKTEFTNRIEENNTTIETNIDFSKLHPTDQSYATNNNPLCFNNEQCLHTSPYLLTNANHICYPIHPTCPLNRTAHLCNPELQTNAQHQTSDGANYKSNEGPNETDVLLKEIHKFVTQDHKIKRNESVCQLRETKTAEVALMTAKSVCGSHVSKRNARVGTPRLQCCSRSCEAIGSPVMNHTQKAYSSYSDTDFERVLELTDMERDAWKPLKTNVEHKDNRSKFSKVLQSLFKKKKSKTKDIEEMDESELTNNSISPRDMRHIQPGEFPPAAYQRYPLYQRRSPPPVRHNYQERYSHHSSRHNRPGQHPQQKEYKHPYAHHQSTHEPQWSHPRPSAPPYQPEHYQNPNLRLQEIETTSTSTQSEKKLSFFKKLTEKLPQAKSNGDYYQYNSTQTQKRQKPGLFKCIPQRPSDIALFTHAEHKKMVLGDTKLRDACLKRMLKKKNPFSSRNLLLKTLMGKDTKPKFDPMKMMRSKLLM